MLLGQILAVTLIRVGHIRVRSLTAIRLRTRMEQSELNRCFRLTLNRDALRLTEDGEQPEDGTDWKSMLFGGKPARFTGYSFSYPCPLRRRRMLALLRR